MSAARIASRVCCAIFFVGSFVALVATAFGWAPPAQVVAFAAFMALWLLAGNDLFRRDGKL